MIIDKIEEVRMSFRKLGSDGAKAANLLGLVIGQVQQTRDNSDAAVIKVINSLLKGIRERIEKRYNENDLADAYREEALLSQFLPQAITDEQLNSIVNGKAVLDLYQVHGPNINLITGKLMAQLSAGVKEGKWSIPNSNSLKKQIETYIPIALDVIGE